MSDYTTGQHVYYEFHAGWGGGENCRAVAVVLGVTAHRVRIALVSMKEAGGKVVEKTVDAGKLTPRAASTHWDARLDRYCATQPEPEPEVTP